MLSEAGHEAGCFSSPDPALKTWKIPGEMLVSVYTGSWKKKKEQTTLQEKGTYSENEASEAKSQISFFHVLSSGLPPEGAVHIDAWPSSFK